MKLTGENRSTCGKTCPSTTLSTTNPIWTDPGSNPGLGGERPATNRLSHDTASTCVRTLSLANQGSSEVPCDVCWCGERNVLTVLVSKLRQQEEDFSVEVTALDGNITGGTAWNDLCRLWTGVTSCGGYGQV
jgi:hypothetical protein